MATGLSSKRRFHVRFEAAEEGGYIISIPEMPGCITEADSFGEGLAMVKDALEGLLEVAMKFDDPIPDQLRGVANEHVA